MLPLLRFSPILKRARWGGRALGTRLNKRVGPEADYSESWEIVDLQGHQSRTIDAQGKEHSLHDLFVNSREELLGSKECSESRFPLLLKFLDANDRLSVQVHPNDEQANLLQPGEWGKTEAWVILEAAPDAVVYAGLIPGTTLEQVQREAASGNVAALLQEIRVKRGDCLLIPAGTVHAVGAGVMLLEIQQSSDLTYRLYDWGWTDADGNPRPLHIQQALQCIDPELRPLFISGESAPSSLKTGIKEEKLVDCDYFEMRRVRVTGDEAIQNSGMRIWSVMEGEGELRAGEQREEVRVGDTVMIPAATKRFEVHSAKGLEVIETRPGSGGRGLEAGG